MNLDQYESVQRWLDRLRAKSAGRKTSTVRVFPHYLGMFCSRIAHKGPDELIAERRLHLKSDDELVRRKHEELVTKFILELQKQGTPSNTVSTAVGAIRSFYNANYVSLVGLVVPRGIPVRSFRIPNRTELKTICEAADPLSRTWILCQKDCGISIADLLRLSLETPSPVYGTVRQQLREGRVPVHLHIVREKTTTAYDSFLGEDAVEALNEWQPSSGHMFPVTDKTVRENFGKAMDRWFCEYFGVGDSKKYLYGEGLNPIPNTFRGSPFFGAKMYPDAALISPDGQFKIAIELDHGKKGSQIRNALAKTSFSVVLGGYDRALVFFCRPPKISHRFFWRTRRGENSEIISRTI